MPAPRIRAHYEDLDSIRNRFAQQADQIRQMSQNVRSKTEVLREGAWIGEAANAFFDEMDNEVLPAVDRLINALDQASQTTAIVADRFHQAEEEASSRFRS